MCDALAASLLHQLRVLVPEHDVWMILSFSGVVSQTLNVILHDGDECMRVLYAMLTGSKLSILRCHIHREKMYVSVSNCTFSWAFLVKTRT